MILPNDKIKVFIVRDGLLVIFALSIILNFALFSHMGMGHSVTGLLRQPMAGALKIVCTQVAPANESTTHTKMPLGRMSLWI